MISLLKITTDKGWITDEGPHLMTFSSSIVSEIKFPYIITMTFSSCWSSSFVGWAATYTIQTMEPILRPWEAALLQAVEWVISNR